jgi:hypothetical protein
MDARLKVLYFFEGRTGSGRTGVSPIMPHSLYCYTVYKNVVSELKLINRHDLPLYVLQRVLTS